MPMWITVPDLHLGAQAPLLHLVTWLCLQQQMEEKIIQVPLSLLAVLHMVCSFVSGDSLYDGPENSLVAAE